MQIRPSYSIICCRQYRGVRYILDGLKVRPRDIINSYEHKYRSICLFLYKPNKKTQYLTLQLHVFGSTLYETLFSDHLQSE